MLLAKEGSSKDKMTCSYCRVLSHDEITYGYGYGMESKQLSLIKTFLSLMLLNDKRLLLKLIAKILVANTKPS